MLTSATTLDSSASYSGGTLPGPADDLTFTASNYAHTNFTINISALSVGELYDKDANQTLSISASESLTLNGVGNLLLYVASSASLN